MVSDPAVRITVPALICFIALSTGCAPKIPETVTTDGLLTLKKGMSYEEVEALVGPPLCVSEHGEYYWEYCLSTPSSVPEGLRNDKITLSYAEDSRWAVHSLKIYVNLANRHLTNVYIKYDDYGVCCMDGLATSPFYWIGSRDMLRNVIGR
jgi:hypothetical protein